MDEETEETEVYTVYMHVTQIEKRHVTAPKGLTFDQLSDWVDENGVGDLLDIDELDNDMVMLRCGGLDIRLPQPRT